MATLAISTDFLSAYHGLEEAQRNRVRELARMFQQLSARELSGQKGIHLEPHNGARDPRAKTIRIDRNHRGIVLDVGDDETFILTTIGTHDETDRWMANNEFRVNEATGALELRNVVQMDEAVSTVVAPVEESATGLFAHRRDRDFVNLGVDADLVPALREIHTDDALQGVLMLLPPPQVEAVMGLLGDDSVDELFAMVAGDVETDDIDTDDLAAAVRAPASASTFHVFADGDELTEALAYPLAQWRFFLHHTQHDVAYRPTFNGPARVTGGPGTGKTVVAIHRARFLAEQIDDEAARPVLFTTFTRNLAEVIEHDLRSLGGTDLVDRIEVVNVDRLAHRVVKDAERLSSLEVASGDEVERYWQQAADRTGSPHSPEFLNNEWEQVILAQGCASRSDYFDVSRAGRGVPLARRDRAAVWKAYEAFQQQLAEADRRTFLQLADAAAGYLAGRAVKPYRHIVVDEAQDLHECQWRMLRAAADEGPNDMFLVGDGHQRIYDRRSSLASVGINIVGRSKRLRINYRTTQEILRWSLGVVGEADIGDADDGGPDDMTEGLRRGGGYHSYLHGPAPVLHSAESRGALRDALVEQVKAWTDAGLNPSDVGIAARTASGLDALAGSLKAAGVPALVLGNAVPTDDGVQLGTMHRMKGLEFRAVAVVDVDDDTVPLPAALTDKSADPVQHRVDLTRERCLLYVACTRARDHLWLGWQGKPSRFIEALL